MLEYESIIKGNQAAMMNSSFALFAHLTGQQSMIRDSKTLLPKPENHPETLWYSMEMMYRYQVTKHRLILYQCKEEWRTYVGTPGYHNTGSCFVSPDKYWPENTGVAFPPTVPFYRRQSTEATFAGGIIRTFNYQNDYRVFSNQTVQFMALSSYLADHTKDPDFLKYAITSATCIKNSMLDSHTTLVLDSVIDAMKGTLKEGGTVSWALTGICIEGLSVLASVTDDHTWRSLAISMAESAMNLKGSHDANGIFSVGSNSILHENDDLKAQKGLLNRGLLVAYQRNPSNKSFRDLVRSYINVQYNALLDLASFGDSYGVNWGGPYVGPYPHGQLAALDTLIAAIGVND
ncbi:hypothetical protein FRC02_006264 [Tulasnella sp. 418]|nr:hypothetical protein FRC02_006264 [Tulasnella sp. 418]